MNLRKELKEFAIITVGTAIVAAQAADELLGVSDVSASFVISFEYSNGRRECQLANPVSFCNNFRLQK